MKNSLLSRFVVFTTLLVAIVAFFNNALSYYLFSAEYMENTEAGLIELARNSSREIETEIQLYSSFLHDLTEEQTIQDFRTQKNVIKLAAFLRNKNEIFQEIELITADGEVALDIEREDLESNADSRREEALFYKALQDPSTVYWDVIPSDKGNRHAFVTFYQGLTSPDAKESWGALRAEAFLEGFTEHATELNNDDGSLLLINTANKRLLPLTVHTENLDFDGIGDAIFKIIENRSDSIYSIAYNKNTLYYFKDGIFNSDWQTVSIISQEDIDEELNKSGAKLLVISLTLCLAAGFTSYLLGKKVVHPLQLVEKKIRQISEGVYEKVDNTTAPGELKILLGSFNEMIDTSHRIINSRNYLESVFKAMQECVMVITLNGQIQKVNHATCTLLGYSEEALLGMNCQELLPETELDWFEAIIKGTGTGSENIREFKNSKGRKIKTNFSWSQFADENGRTRGIVCVFAGRP